MAQDEDVVQERSESILDQDFVIGALEFDHSSDDLLKVFEAIRVAQHLDHQIEVEWVQGTFPSPPDEKPYQRIEREKKSQVLIFKAFSHE